MWVIHECNADKRRNKQCSRRQTVKVLKIMLILVVLAGLSGCILVPWDWDGDHGHGGGEHHEGHR